MPVPTFQTIPDSWKHPHGPYRQAPVEYGGRWWLVNPFTSAEPWMRVRPDGPQQVPPPEFIALFGPRPEPNDFAGLANPGSAYRTARGRWEQDLRYFKGIGTPPWADAQQMRATLPIYEHWGLGAPTFYQGRYGWLTRFQASTLPREDFSAFNSLELPHLTVAAYQIKLVELEQTPSVRHPFVPTELWDTDETGDE